MTYEELVKNHAGDLVEKLVTDVLSKDAIEVRFEFEDDDQWAVISMHIYEEDKEISLRLHADNKYQLHFGYYDDEDEFSKSINCSQRKKSISSLKKLQKVMTKVLADERGMRLPGNFLSK